MLTGRTKKECVYYNYLPNWEATECCCSGCTLIWKWWFHSVILWINQDLFSIIQNLKIFFFYVFKNRNGKNWHLTIGKNLSKWTMFFNQVLLYYKKHSFFPFWIHCKCSQGIYGAPIVFPLAISMEKGCKNHRETLYSSKGKIVYVVGKPCVSKRERKSVFCNKEKLEMKTKNIKCKLD